MGLIYSVSVLFFAFMIFRMYLKKDIRPYMTSRVVTLLTILGLLPYVNTVIIIATLGDAVVKFNEYRKLGISGGIDSTVVAAICHEVSKKTSSY